MKRAMKLTAMLALVTLTSGCVTSGAGSGCAGWQVIRLDGQSIDGLTDRDARAVLAHNEFGKARGCW
jgi:hypothetical protein